MGYEFVSWEEGEKTISEEPFYELLIEKDRLIEARFKLLNGAYRLHGSHRFQTAVTISQQAYPNGSQAVVLARGDDFADALAGVSLAHQMKAPILLTGRDQVYSSVEEEIRRLGADKAVLLGGEGALSAEVALELESLGLSVDRVSGQNRYETAAAIAYRLKENGADVKKAVMVVGSDFPDALAAAAYAAREEMPVLLTGTTFYPGSTEQAVDDLGIKNVVVVGGPSVITDEVMADFPDNGETMRLYGDDRYETATALAQYYYNGEEHFYLATGLDFPDAVTGAVLAAKTDAGVLLVYGPWAEPNQVVQDFLAEKQTPSLFLFGGEAVISSDMKDWLNEGSYLLDE